jgi:hypothetical protein
MNDHIDDRSGAALRPSLTLAPTIDEPESLLRSTLESVSWMSSTVRELADLVGGLDQLLTLDDVPVPDAPFNWLPVSTPHRDLVETILLAIESDFGDPPVIDAEFRGIAKRLLARLAEREPAVLRRSTPTRIAAAIVWLALEGNDALGRGQALKAGDVWRLFGVSSSPDVGRTLFEGLGLESVPQNDSWYYARRNVRLTDPRLQHSRTRRKILDRRAEVESAARQDLELGAAKHLIKVVDTREFVRDARPITPRLAERAKTKDNRPVVIVTLGDRHWPAEVLALTLRDAHQLMVMLENTLERQLPTHLGEDF